MSLRLDEVVTRDIFHLGGEAEWRYRREGKKVVPLSLAVTVLAHEDPVDPANVTNAYLAVAKVSPSDSCITTRLKLSGQSKSRIRLSKQRAHKEPCLRALGER